MLQQVTFKGLRIPHSGFRIPDSGLQIPTFHNDGITILRDMPLQTEQEIEANRPDVLIKNKQEKNGLLIDMSIPNEKNTSV